MSNKVPQKSEIEDDFVDVSADYKGSSPSATSEHHHGHKDHQDPDEAFFKRWSNQGSAPHSSPGIVAANVLRKQYPKHSLVSTEDWILNGALFSFPGLSVEALPNLLTNVFFYDLPPHSNPIPGILVDGVQYGAFKVEWENMEFLAFRITYPLPYGTATCTLILHDGPEDPIRSMLLTVGIFAVQLHNEIWVFNQGYWSKDASLYTEVQKANWDDVILEADFKAAFRKDVFGFFKSEDLYKSLSIPWKRGIIMHGPPGNGKTISIKAIMKDCITLGHAPLYVKSFQGWGGEEVSMAAVFGQARKLAPCVLVLEDLDSLINDSNRSFFLNQLDGLSGNDGLLVIGTTNHFDRLDPGLSTRPSRFDRKFLFDDPVRDDRALYAQYWQKKLASNKEIDFPDSLVAEIADTTSGFSFAYLKEAFVSSLVTLAGFEEKDKPSFLVVVKDQIKQLRKQLHKPSGDLFEPFSTTLSGAPPSRPAPPADSHGIRAILDALSESTLRGERQGKIFTTMPAAAPHQRFNNPYYPHPEDPLSDSVWATLGTDAPGPGRGNAAHHPVGLHPPLPGAWNPPNANASSNVRQFNPLWFDGPANNPFA